MSKQPVHKVFIVEDHLAMRQAYVDLISREANLEICGIATTAQDALQQIPESRPDIALVDISLNEMNGIDLTHRLTTEFPEMLTLIISGHEEAFYARKAIEAGASGFVTKRRVRAIMQAIQEVLKGNVYISTPTQDSIKRQSSLLK